MSCWLNRNKIIKMVSKADRLAKAERLRYSITYSARISSSNLRCNHANPKNTCIHRDTTPRSRHPRVHASENHRLTGSHSSDLNGTIVMLIALIYLTAFYVKPLDPSFSILSQTDEIGRHDFQLLIFIC